MGAILIFEVDPKKFFDVDAEALEQVQEGDTVLVRLDYSTRKAEYLWYPEGENPANYEWIEDDFESIEQEFAIEIGKATEGGSE